MAQICPKCSKSRIPVEKYVNKDGKRWRILYCFVCLFNFDLEESPLPPVTPPLTPKLDKKTKRFKFGFEE